MLPRDPKGAISPISSTAISPFLEITSRNGHRLSCLYRVLLFPRLKHCVAVLAWGRCSARTGQSALHEIGIVRQARTYRRLCCISGPHSSHLLVSIVQPDYEYIRGEQPGILESLESVKGRVALPWQGSSTPLRSKRGLPQT